MSMEKQKLYKEIDTLPEELTNQVINFIEYSKYFKVFSLRIAPTILAFLSFFSHKKGPMVFDHGPSSFSC